MRGGGEGSGEWETLRYDENCTWLNLNIIENKETLLNSCNFEALHSSQYNDALPFTPKPSKLTTPLALPLMMTLLKLRTYKLFRESIANVGALH